MSAYAKKMARLSARIFGEVSRPTSQKSTRVVKLFSEKPVSASPEIYAYYPRHQEINHLFRELRFLGLFRDEHLDFKEEMTRLKVLRGKKKPAKGEGKRASKRK